MKTRSWTLSEDQRKEILQRTRAGQLQKTIVKEMHLDKETVRKYQAAAGLQPHPGFILSPEQEKQILLLKDEGHGAPHIAKELQVPQYFVSKFLHQHFRDRSGRYDFTPHELASIRRDLRLARSRIAAKWNVTSVWLRKIENSKYAKFAEYALIDRAMKRAAEAAVKELNIPPCSPTVQ